MSPEAFTCSDFHPCDPFQYPTKGIERFDHTAEQHRKALGMLHNESTWGDFWERMHELYPPDTRDPIIILAEELDA